MLLLVSAALVVVVEEVQAPDLLRRSITPWVSNICWRSSCAITGSTAGVGACVGPGSKNPGGIPNVAVLPLCPLPPGLDWLGNPIGVLGKAAEETPGEKLSQGVVLAHGSPLPCRGSPMWYTGVVPAWTAPSLLRLFLQERWLHFLDSQCCLAPYLDSLAQVQTSSQVKIS